MMLAFLIVAPIVFYFMVAGYSAKKIQMHVIKNCSDCELVDGEWLHNKRNASGRHVGEMYSTTHHDASPALCVFWPIVLPVIWGLVLGNLEQSKRDKQMHQLEKDRVRRLREIEEAQHQVKLATLRTRENDLLDQHLTLERIRREQLDG